VTQILKDSFGIIDNTPTESLAYQIKVLVQTALYEGVITPKTLTKILQKLSLPQEFLQEVENSAIVSCNTTKQLITDASSWMDKSITFQEHMVQRVVALILSHFL
jgi:hypothetical protein